MAKLMKCDGTTHQLAQLRELNDQIDSKKKKTTTQLKLKAPR